MVPEPVSKPEIIGLCSPAEKGDFVVTVYLYSIEESGESRNNQMRSMGTGQLQYPPMAVYLDYLITAHSTADLQSRMLDENRILGRVMQIFHDNAIIKGSLLQGCLAEKNEPVRISLKKINVDEMSRIWNFPNIPYKLSVVYRVGPVDLESTRTRSTRRVTGVGT
jgi:hypothetical protein